MEAQIDKLTSMISTLIALQVVTVASVVGMTWYSHKQLKQYVSTVTSAGSPTNTPESIDDWEGLVREHNAAHGPPDAPIVFVEYSDFQCPFCKRFTEGTRDQIVTKYGDRVRMVFKHYPLEMHAQAMTAAMAAQCARREGKFWEIHDRFFNQQNALDEESVIVVGQALGLSPSYADCVRNEETRPEVEQDMRDAQAVGVQATPTFMINGRFLVGVQSEAAFRAAFDEAGLVIN